MNGRRRIALLESKLWSVAAWAGIAMLCVGAVVSAVRANWIGAAVLIAFAAGCIAFTAWNSGLPRVFNSLVVIAAMLNAAGWAYTIFRIIPGYDETAHGFTTFTLTLILGFFAWRSTDGYFRSHPWTLAVGIASISIALGALWEVVELAFGVVETRRNSIKDLLMDSIGAAVAAALVVWGMRRRCRRTP